MKKLKKFITFEGGEGTGKSTTAKYLKKMLIQKGYDTYLTREPGGNGLKIAEDIRKIIMKHENMHPITELLLFNASRREHIDKIIKPKLNEGKIVISDRFSDSTLIYQGIARNIDADTINLANNIATKKTEPDLVFIFDLDPEEGKTRIKSNNRITNRFDNEKINFHNKIRQGYLKLQKQNTKKYILVDASKSTEEISNFIFNKIINE